MKFIDLRLSEPILRAVADEGYHTATPIQAQVIPHALTGRDVLGCARTGTGKTAAFALPVLHGFNKRSASETRRRPRHLVLCPTRELAVQIGLSFETYGRYMSLRCAVVYGGVDQAKQVRALRNGVDVLVATPGRLLDLADQGHAALDGVQTLVLDEADRMLDMGFMPDIRRVLSQVPQRRQTMLFSATMPKEFRRLADRILHKPVSVQVADASNDVDQIDQSVHFVERRQKADLLAQVVRRHSITRALVFTRTKRGADRLVRHLQVRGLNAEAIHGNKSQSRRLKSLERFRSGRLSLLIATDVASRGIDVDGISHVFNYDLPHEPETYVHRIGRTGRAGRSGTAVSFCDGDERGHLDAIQRRLQTRIRIDCEPDGGHPSKITSAAPATDADRKDRQRRAPGRTGGARRGRSKKARRQVSAGTTSRNLNRHA
ncbi:MAG: DEAD/DEAH box helicase [Phycisphaeraceae bacterium]|nr:DEAD/DEAH box helicase [Phycisphaeraceae bacterium]